MNDFSDVFYIEKEPGEEALYFVGAKVVVYVAKHKKYPPFLSEYDAKINDKIGCTTKFYFVLNDYTMMTEADATAMAAKLNSEYKDIVHECEDSGDWSNYPYEQINWTIYHTK